MRSRLLWFLLCGPLLVFGDDLGTLDGCEALAERLASRVAELEAQLEEARAAVMMAERPSRLTAFLHRGSDEAGFAARRLEEGCEEALVPFGTPEFYQHAAAALVCVCLAAMAAGLTIGLVSLEVMDMEIIVKTEENDMPTNMDKQRLKDNKKNAKKLLPLIHDHHRLLVTLLLMNSFANEALPLFLDQLVPSWLAVLMSMTLVLIFGEIIPSAIFTGSDQLRMAASFAPAVFFFRAILAPVARPIAKALDCLLGADHKGRYNFAELRAVVEMHAKLHVHSEVTFKSVDDTGIITTEQRNDFTEETAVIFTNSMEVTAKSSVLEVNTQTYYVKPCVKPGTRDHGTSFRLYSSEERHPKDMIELKSGDITAGIFKVQERDELKIMHGVMTLTHMTAQKNMVPLRKVEMLENTKSFDTATLQMILQKGYSRLPVFERSKHNVRGFLLVKKLIVISPNDGSTAGNYIEKMVVVHEDIPMLDLLNKFQEERIHIALVTNDPAVVESAWQKGEEIPPDVHMAGIITLEDIIEKLIQEDIEDEHDCPPRTSPSLYRIKTASGASGIPVRMNSRSFNPPSYETPGLVTEASLKEPLLQAVISAESTPVS